MTVRYPRALATSARPMPVLPAVPSTTRPPGRISPRFSASTIIWRAGLSFTDWPGFRNSALPRIVQPVASETRRSLINGVLPIASIMPFCTCMGPPAVVLDSLVHSKARTGRQFGHARAGACHAAGGEMRCAFCPVLYQFAAQRHGRVGKGLGDETQY